MQAQGITIARLLEDCSQDFDLEILTECKESRVRIRASDLNRPGLALIGFTQGFLFDRVQILGETETLYLQTLKPDEQKAAVASVLAFELPCIIVTKGLPIPDCLVGTGDVKQVPVLRTRMATTQFMRQMTSYLERLFAPQATIHGTLVDVYGVGVLFTGRSGVGKSECALDLVERGHRLVADDVVTVKRRMPGVIVGTGSEILQHHMEIRGLGIIDIQSMFGVRAIRLQKRIEVEAKLREWDSRVDYERLGLEDEFTSILGVKIPVVTIPIFPGKNITVIAEVLALNHLLKSYGILTAERFSRRLGEMIDKRAEVGRLVTDDVE